MQMAGAPTLAQGPGVLAGTGTAWGPEARFSPQHHALEFYQLGEIHPSWPGEEQASEHIHHRLARRGEQTRRTTSCYAVASAQPLKE